VSKGGVGWMVMQGLTSERLTTDFVGFFDTLKRSPEKQDVAHEM